MKDYNTRIICALYVNSHLTFLKSMIMRFLNEVKKCRQAGLIPGAKGIGICIHQTLPIRNRQ